MRPRTPNEMYSLLEKETSRLLDQLDEAVVEHTLLPALYGGVASLPRKWFCDGLRRRIREYVYPFLRYSFAFEKTRSCGRGEGVSSLCSGAGPGGDFCIVEGGAPHSAPPWTRVNPWVLWLPICLGLKAFFRNPFAALESVRQQPAVLAVRNRFSFLQNIKSNVRLVARGWLHGVNAVALGYAGWHFGGYFVGSPEGDAARYTVLRKFRVVAEGGVLWRRRPLWLATVGDRDFPKNGEEIWVFVEPGTSQSEQDGGSRAADRGITGESSLSGLSVDGRESSSSVVVKSGRAGGIDDGLVVHEDSVKTVYGMVEHQNQTLFVPLKYFDGETQRPRWLLREIA